MTTQPIYSNDVVAEKTESIPVAEVAEAPFVKGRLYDFELLHVEYDGIGQPGFSPYEIQISAVFVVRCIHVGQLSNVFDVVKVITSKGEHKGIRCIHLGITSHGIKIGYGEHFRKYAYQRCTQTVDENGWVRIKQKNRYNGHYACGIDLAYRPSEESWSCSIS